jgi:hypothetical protein
MKDCGLLCKGGIITLEETIAAIEALVQLTQHMKTLPTKLVINENLITTMAKDFKFWEAPQFKTQISSTAPVLNKFRPVSAELVLQVIPDSNELLFHLE